MYFRNRKNILSSFINQHELRFRRKSDQILRHQNAFKNISFHINEGDKIAIVAKNGTGKSTLLKILLGKEIADSGEVVINKDVQVVLFDQEIEFDSQLSVEEFMMTLDSKPIQALKIIIKSLHSTDQKFIEKALAEMEIHKAWDLETEMKQILSQLKSPI